MADHLVNGQSNMERDTGILFILCIRFIFFVRHRPLICFVLPSRVTPFEKCPPASEISKQRMASKPLTFASFEIIFIRRMELQMQHEGIQSSEQ
jgi:hypothetical protein